MTILVSAWSHGGYLDLASLSPLLPKKLLLESCGGGEEKFVFKMNVLAKIDLEFFKSSIKVLQFG